MYNGGTGNEGIPVAGAAMVLKDRIHGDDYNAVGSQNEEGGEAKRQNPFYQRQFGTAKVKGDRHAFFIKDEEYKKAGSELRQHRSGSGSCNLHMKNKNK